jgi:transcription elongation factor Elf1
MVSVPVGKQASTVVTERVEFTCRYCGHRAEAEVTGLGEGADSFLNAEGTAVARAEQAARRDVGRTIARALCPRCGRRDHSATLRFFFPYVAVSVAFVLAGIVAGFAPTWFDVNMSESDKQICKWVMPLIIIVPVLLVVPISAIPKWTSTDRRVKWL